MESTNILNFDIFIMLDSEIIIICQLQKKVLNGGNSRHWGKGRVRRDWSIGTLSYDYLGAVEYGVTLMVGALQMTLVSCT